MQLVIKVIPQASVNKIIGFHNNMLKVALIGIPEKGKLNEALVHFLAEMWAIPKKAIVIKQGLTNPVKRVEISCEFNLKVDLYLAKFKPLQNSEDENF